MDNGPSQPVMPSHQPAMPFPSRSDDGKTRFSRRRGRVLLAAGNAALDSHIGQSRDKVETASRKSSLVHASCRAATSSDSHVSGLSVFRFNRDKNGGDS